MSSAFDENLITSPHPPGKDEMNFAEFPIALLTDRVPKGQKSIKFEDQIYDEKRKKLVTRRRIIEGSEEYGLPTATDDAVILALIQLTKEKSKFKNREVEFSRLELIKMLGWPNEGKSYERIKLSLLRITNVTYNYDNAWWDPRQKSWTTRAFHIIDSVQINDSRASAGQSGLLTSRIVWGDAVFESFQSGFLRNIDFQLCMRLEHPTALRMYRFLGKRFHVRPDWTFELKEFAYEHIGLGRNYEGGTQIARKLQPAILELEGMGFLERLSPADRFAKRGRDWSIRLVQKPLALPLVTVGKEMADPSETRTPLSELVNRGISPVKAGGLVTQFPPELISAQIEVFDWLSARKDKKLSRNPAGYLIKSIEGRYTAPKDYVPQSVRFQQEITRQEIANALTLARIKQHQQQAREKAEEEAIDAYWSSLTSEQQVALDAACLALADPEKLKLEVGPLKRMGQHVRRRAHIRHLLGKRNGLPLLPEDLGASQEGSQTSDLGTAQKLLF